MSEPKRVLSARLSHETHNFVEGTTGIDKFVINRDLPATRRNDGSSMDGFIEIAEREGWQPIVTIEWRAPPAGTVDHAVFEQFWKELDERIDKAMAEKPLDAIWLSLHGAMVTSESDDPESELFTRIRAKPGLADILHGVWSIRAPRRHRARA